MKTNFKIAWLIVLLAGMPLLLSAQEKDRSSLPREVLSPEKVAKRETDEMKKQLQLTEKQYKKIYKLNLKEQKKRFSAMQNSERPNPPMDRPHGMGGGRPPMMGGEPPAMGGERPDRGENSQREDKGLRKCKRQWPPNKKIKRRY
ncbi:hypothetical protein NXX53_03140 [Bacteroides salyersiae]|nr:hypothetical protein [Bacteroides salyersiae]